MSRSVHVPVWLLLAACGADDVASSDSRTTLLISGDRVTLPAKGAPQVTPAPGREKVGFFTVRSGDHAAVIPNDLMGQVARGELSPSLFEIGAPAVAAEDDGKLVDLHFDALGASGNSTIGSGVLFGPPRGFQFIHAGDTVPIIAGAQYEIFFGGFEEPLFMVLPKLIVEENTDVVLDGRLARFPEVSAPGQTLAFTGSQISYANNDGGGGNGTLVTGVFERLTATAGFGPPPAPGVVTVLSVVEMAAQNGEPYLFAHRQDGLPNGFTLVGSPDRVATVNAKVRATAEQVHERHASPVLFDADLTTSEPVARLQAQGPFERTEHYVNNPGVSWVPSLQLIDEAEGFNITEQGGVAAPYQPGRRIDELWNRAPFGPAFSVFEGVPQASRNGDELRVAPSMFSEVATPSRIGVAAGDLHTALFRNNELIQETGEDGTFELADAIEVPAAAADYRLEASAKRDPAVSDLSSEVSATWTFRSGHTGGLQVLSLPTMRFTPNLDRNNASIAGLPLVLPVHIERLPGAATPAIRAISVEASFDDGATWHAVPGARIGADFVGIVLPPARATFLSLRGNASDVAGNRVEQTIIHASRLRKL